MPLIGSHVELTIPFLGSVPISGSTTQQCSDCGGDGTVTETRDKRLDELYNTQIGALFEADMFRETGGEEAQKQQRQMRSGPGGPGGMGGSSSVPSPARPGRV